MKWYELVIAMVIGTAACMCVLCGHRFSPLFVLGGFLATINFFIGRMINKY